MEAALQTTLAAICQRTYPTVAPATVTAPYVLWQQVGGVDMSYVENSRALRHALVQISVWGPSPAAVGTIRESIESTLRQHATLIAKPSGAHRMLYEPETKLHGLQQDWDIWTD